MKARFFLTIGLGLVMLSGMGIPANHPKQRNANGSAAGSEITPLLFHNLRGRNIGPANMMGRVTDIEGVPGDSNLVYVGTASGGIWKTVNGGTTWKPIFDKQPVLSIGDLALEPGNPDVIYAGTGESNVRNSVSFGNGVYKSTDGGKTWVHLGLGETRHISRIKINPHNPQVVYIGALGHAFGPNQDRGVFRSQDGGKTWVKTLYTSSQHGVADLDINPNNPNIVYAALWHFERKPWTFTSGDTQGGVYRSVDNGKSWKRLTNGLPELVGRIGIKVAPSNPEIVYVITEAQEGTLYRSDDRGDSFRRVSQNVEIVSRGFYYTDLRVDPTDENRVYAVSSRLFLSLDGGEKFKAISPTTHVDYHTLWIDPIHPQRMWQGQDGGICISYDRGLTWDYTNNIPLAQFYQIFVDKRDPFYYVGGGLQDNGTWYGPNRNREPFGILNDDWRMISFGDGFHIVVHPEDPELFLSEYQGGGIVRTNMRTREQQDISPQPRRADGAPVSSLKYRFNWNAPIVMSPHSSDRVYLGGNVVFRSDDFGTQWEIISPDLTTNDPEKQKEAGGPAWPENTTAEYHCTVISLAESPVQPDVLWAGTDDGNLHVSLNGGEEWNNISESIPGIEPFSPVSHVEPSITSAGTAYCSFDRHMLDDYQPYIFKTTDFGRTWVKASGNLPETAYVWVVREDPKNPQVLYAGTEIGLFVSFSLGQNWVKLEMGNFPAVSVHDILVHPRENDLVVGTHGRALWIFDSISYLQELSPELLERDVYIFTIRPGLRFTSKPTRYGIGDSLYQGQNPPYGALITYYLREAPSEDIPAVMEVLNTSREVIRTIKNIPRKAGFNRMAWDLQLERPRSRTERNKDEDIFFGGPLGPQALPGDYTVRLVIGERSFEKPVKIRLDPSLDISSAELLEIQEYALKIREMQSLTNDALRALDTLKHQLEDRNKVWQEQKRETSTEISQVIKTGLQRIQAITNGLVRPEGKPYWSEGPRLMGRISSLFFAINGVNASPTDAQKQYFNELKEEWETALTEFNNFLESSPREINEKFVRYQVPEIVIPEKISLDINIK